MRQTVRTEPGVGTVAGTTTVTIGLVGLGLLGSAMAQRLLAHGTDIFRDHPATGAHILELNHKVNLREARQRLGPGIHHLEGGLGILRLKSGQTLYVAPGAVLRARLLAEDASDIRFCGRDVLEGTTLLGRQPDYYRKFLGEPDGTPRPNFVQFNRCQNITVEGIVLNDSPAWSLVFNHCENVRVENLKQFGYVDNSDGIDVVSSRHVVIRDWFARVNDGCLAIKSHSANVRDVTVSDSMLWSDRAVGLQIGHETLSSNIWHITCRNIDILEPRNRYIHHYAMGIFNGDDATVSDVLFEDIRVDHCQRLISLIVEKGFFNKSKDRGLIENICCRNIRRAVRNDIHLYGFDDAHAVRGITFEDLDLPGRSLPMNRLFVVRALACKGPPGTRFVPLAGEKIYIQQWNNAYPDRVIESIKTVTALCPEVPIVLGVALDIGCE
jgi:hypothetical protein